MFKKAVEAKSLQRLSGADKKKLRRSVKEKFSRASDADVDVLLPPKGEITLAKFQNRVLVYGVEGGFPMFFDADGRGSELYPTVYALWKVPDLVPAFMLKGGEVSRFIIGGADLMFPGICIPPEGFPSFVAGEPWSVKVPGNPAPIAVGATTMSSAEALKAGLRGKALRITHYYHDYLWESVEGRFVPNAGFFEDAVFPDPSFMASHLCEGDGSVDKKSDNEEAMDPDVVNNVCSEHDPASSSHLDNNNDDISEQVAEELGGLTTVENDAVQSENQQSLSTEDVDVLLDRCLLQALHTTVKDKDLPMPGSTLWANHVLPCRPSGITLDIKKSSFKKLSKWLQSKASAGVITVKEDKHKKEVVLFSVNRNHADYKSFKPEKRQPDKVEESSEQAAADSQSQKLLEIEEVYKPSIHVNAIFTAVGADTGAIFTASEAANVAFAYVEKENLVKPTNKAMVILDATLCDALFKGAIKKGTAYPTEIHKKDLGTTFLSRMQAHHKVTRGGDSVIRKGAVKPIHILTERRQGNKKMTKLSGFEIFLMDAESLASELQKKFACSTTVAELPGKKGHEVLVQGGVIDHLAKHLMDQYGVPKRYIEVLDKTRR
ncbi:eukaryotic translation initiation factor 2D-like [Chenopodium quinoa]|nr:eukaryotic translation initiation factor 2D-like [Chenopodium quinoa]